MYTSRKHSNTAIHIIIHIMLASVLMLGPRLSLASEETPNEAGAMVLMLENSDSNNKMSTFPHGDEVSLLNSKGELVKKFHGLEIQNTYSGCKKISASEDGRFFVVCEYAPGKLTMYETATRKELWILWMDFNSAVFANDLIYAVNRHNLFAIDYKGTIVKHSRLGGFDIAVDKNHDCLWIVGSDVKKCNLDFQMVFKARLKLGFDNNTGAFSVDVNPDGSVWIAEQNVFEKYGSKNQLVKRSLSGSIQKTIDLNFSPIRVRIDRSDGSVWTTGRINERDF